METIKNLKIYKKFEELKNKHPKLVKYGGIAALVGTGIVVIALGVNIIAGPGKPEPPTVDDNEPQIEENQEMPAEPEVLATLTPAPNYGNNNIEVDQGTCVRLEPLKNAAYVEKITGNTYAEKILEDGDYVLIRHRNSSDTYFRYGYVPKENVRNLPNNKTSGVFPSSGYVYFTKNARIRNEANLKHDARNILTNAKQGSYGRIIGVIPGAEWENEHWIIVTYNGYIGLCLNTDVQYIDEYAMQEIMNREEHFVRITGTGVRFRTTPNLNANNVHATLNNGDTLTLIDEDAEWYHVFYGNKEGYISKQVNCIERVTRKATINGLDQLHFPTANEYTEENKTR